MTQVDRRYRREQELHPTPTTLEEKKAQEEIKSNPRRRNFQEVLGFPKEHSDKKTTSKMSFPLLGLEEKKAS